MIACDKGCVETVELLIQKQVKINTQDYVCILFNYKLLQHK